MEDATLKIKEGGPYTYADYLTWNTNEQWELIDGKAVLKSTATRYEILDGVAYMMSSPSIIHQKVSGEIFFQLRTFLAEKPCQVFAAPLDVRLFPKADSSDAYLVQPDLFVVCDSLKLEGNVCIGAPTLVIEILSPSTSSYDCIFKFAKYRDAGVKEYWIVDPENKMIIVNILENGQYVSTPYYENDELPIATLPKCVIKIRDIW